jgi:hypothetical protein
MIGVPIALFEQRHTRAIPLSEDTLGLSWLPVSQRDTRPVEVRNS